MYVNKERRLVYLAHPKTASQATSGALERRGFVRKLRSPRGYKDRRCPAHHRGLERHPGEGWTVFTVVRNHYDALASWWAFQARKPVLKGVPLTPDYIRNLMETFPYYFVHPNRMWDMHGRVADTVLRYEHLQNDLSALLGEDVCPPHENVSPAREGRHYHDLIDGPTRAFIGETFGDEMAEYGYSW